VQHAAVPAFAGGDEIEDYLLRSRAILAALTEHCRARLEAAGADVPAPDGAFYLLPGFAAHRESLARRGIMDDAMLAERLITDVGIATLPGSSFGIDPTALRLRLALVDFDGRGALVAATTESVDTAFVERHCTPTLRAVAALARYAADA
jgi:aspartate/methionine/tyrosine aminotransferase